MSDYVSGNTGGLQRMAVNEAAGAVFDLSAWAGSYVKIGSHGNVLEYVFSADEGPVAKINLTEALDAAEPAAGAPDLVADGGAEHEVVPSEAPFLHVRAVDDTATTRVKVRRASKVRVA